MRTNVYLSNLSRISTSLVKKYVFFKKIKPVYFFLGLLLIIIVYSSLLINSNLKAKRTKQISSFLSNNQTVLLRNYIFNKIKSPYLEYDYIVKSNDTI